MVQPNYKVTILCIIVIFVGIFGWYEYHRTVKSTQNLTPLFSIDASSLITEFETSEDSASAKYNGHIVQVTGIVKAIELSDSTGRIMLNSEKNTAGIICELEKSQLKKASKIVKGQWVTIKGICTGFLLDIVFINVTIH